jgi:hypothetical protein
LRDLWKFELNLIYRLGGDSFCSLVNDLLLRYCTYRCNGQKHFVIHFFERWRIDLQISIFGFSHELLRTKVFRIYHREYVKLSRYTPLKIIAFHRVSEIFWRAHVFLHILYHSATVTKNICLAIRADVESMALSLSKFGKLCIRRYKFCYFILLSFKMPFKFE